LAKKSEKAAAISVLTDKFSRAQGVVLADYRGLNVAQMTELRRRARAAGVEIRVIKNTLAARAAAPTDAARLDPHFQGPTAAAFGYEDPVAPARLLVEFARTARQLELKVGLAEGRLLSAAEVRALAALPSREVLLAQVVAGLQGPLQNLASVLAAPLRGVVTAVDALRQQTAAG